MGIVGGVGLFIISGKNFFIDLLKFRLEVKVKTDACVGTEVG